MRLFPLNHRLTLDLFGPNPKATINGVSILFKELKPEEGKYYEILCFLAAKGGEASLRSLCRAIDDPVSPEAMRADKRAVAQLARARTPKPLWNALGHPPDPTAATYLVVEGDRAFLREVDSDLIRLWRHDGSSFDSLDQEGRDWVESRLRTARADSFMEGVETAKGWDGRWFRGARDEIGGLFDRLHRPPVHDETSAPPPDRSGDDGNLARLFATEPNETKDALKALLAFSGACSIRALRFAANRRTISVDDLRDLRKKGLVDIELEKSEPRYSLPPRLFRSLIDEIRPQDLEAYRARHRDFFLGVVERCARGLAAPDSPKYRERLTREYAQIKAAINWSLEKEDAKALVFCYMLQNYWGSEPNIAASLQLCELIVDRFSKTRSVALARSYNCALALAYFLMSRDKAQTYYEECTSIWNELDVAPDVREKGINNAENNIALVLMSTAEIGSDKYKSVGARVKAVREARERESKDAEGELAKLRGEIAEREEASLDLQGEITDAEEKLKECRFRLANALYNLAIYHYYEDEHYGRPHTTARGLLDECSKISRSPKVDHKEGLALCNLMYGKCYLSEDRYEESYRCLRRSIDLLSKEVKEVQPQIEALEAIAYLCAKTHRSMLAARLLARSKTQRNLYQYRESPRDDSEFCKYIAPMIEDWGESNYHKWYSDPGFGSFQGAVQYVVETERLESETS